MSETKALVFDLGKVIFDVSFGFAFDVWAKHAGLEQKEVSKRFRFDEQYEAFERDEITPSEYAAHISQLIGCQLNFEQFKSGWNAIYLDAYPGIGKLLEALKKNYKLVSLTNTNRVHAEVWPQKYADVLQHFEIVFSSFEMKVRKPEEASYRRVIEYLSLSPQEIIFLDDRLENTEAAAKTGMKTILVTSSSQMKEKLIQNGIRF